MSQSKKMNLIQAISLVISGIVGSGIMILSKNLASFKVWGILVWPFTAFLVYSIFNVFHRLSLNVKDKNGEPVSDLIGFVEAKLGERYAYLLSFGYFVATCATGAFVANVCSSYFLLLLQSFGIYADQFSVSVAIFAFLLILNIVSFGAANSILVYLTVIKLLFLLLVGIVGIFFFKQYNFSFGNGVSDLMLATPVTIFAFFGFEYAMFASKSIENPEKNVSLATKIGLAISTLIFVLVHCAVVFILGDEATVLSSTPVFDAMVQVFGPLVGFVIALIGVVSCITTLNAILVVQGNLFQKISIDYLFPRLALKTSQGFPFVGSILTVVFSSLINSFKLKVIEYATFLGLLVYLTCIIIDFKMHKLNFSNVLAFLSVVLILGVILNQVESLLINVLFVYFFAAVLRFFKRLFFSK